MSLLHKAISTFSFMASTGFYMGESLLDSGSGISIQALSTVNSICGSTESSRAVASVIHLLTHELNKPEDGEVIKYREIVFAVIGFVLLQRWGRRKTQIDFRNAGGEVPIWDMVIDDKGWRADVVGTRRKENVLLKPAMGHTVSFSSPDGEEDLEVLEKDTLFENQHIDFDAANEVDLSDEELKDRIMAQLPEGARAVISSQTVTARTIKVELFNADTAHIEAPPGTVMVSERLNHESGADKETPSQTIFFRTALKRSSSSEVHPTDKLRLTSIDDAMDVDDQDGLVMMGGLTAGKDELDTERLDRDNHGNSKKLKGPTANEKKSRKPIFAYGQSAEDTGKSRVANVKSPKSKPVQIPKQEKEGKIKKALKTLSPSSSVTAMRDAPNILPRRRNDAAKPLPKLPTMTSTLNMSPQRLQPLSSLSNGHTPKTSPIMVGSPEETATSSYFTVHETRRDSKMSQTDTYSIHSVDSRPGSPTFNRSQSKVISHTKSEIGLSVQGSEARPDSTASLRHHSRSKSFVPSLYSMGSKHSGEAVVLAPKRPIPRKSIYEDNNMVDLLMAEGKVPAIFPDRHLAKTVRRFARFATAVYGFNFMQVMGLLEEQDYKKMSRELIKLDVPHEHKNFAAYTGLPADTILRSSFVDPEGITGNTEWSSSALGPLFHFISLDHDSKAVVLTCRGTLGFQDVLTDMACDYDDIYWQGQRYRVHKGIHHSARRLLSGTSRYVMTTIKKALEENPDYGLILTGHSLGGAVAAVVAIMISEPAPNSSSQSFVTGAPPKLLPSAAMAFTEYSAPIPLPRGRPVHVYAYGPPATFSEPLRLATRGLITTVVNAGDIVPCLSLGTLHDFRTAAVHLKHDTSDAMSQVRARVWQRIMAAFSLSTSPSATGPPAPEFIAGDGVGEDTWAWATLKTLRAAMSNDKLVPPGEIFLLETTQVFDRLGADVKQEARYGFGADEGNDGETAKMYQALGRPATRVQFKLIRDVSTRFAELRFGRDMFTDHSPGRYEYKLGLLEKGVCEDE